MADTIKRHFFDESADEHIQHSEQGYVLYADHLTTLASKEEEIQRIKAALKVADEKHVTFLVTGGPVVMESEYNKLQESVERLKGLLREAQMFTSHHFGCRKGWPLTIVKENSMVQDGRVSECTCGYEEHSARSSEFVGH